MRYATHAVRIFVRFMRKAKIMEQNAPPRPAPGVPAGTGGPTQQKHYEFRMKDTVRAMIEYGSPILVQFPREEKYLLAQMIRETMYQMLHICNEINRKFYKKDTVQKLNVLLDDLRDYLDLAASPKLYPRGTGGTKKRRRRHQNGDGTEMAPQQPQQEPRPITCITEHQLEVWSRYTAALGGQIYYFQEYIRRNPPGKG